MKHLKLLLLACISVSVIGCSQTPDYTEVLNNLKGKVMQGNLTSAIHLADSLKRITSSRSVAYKKADSITQIAERIRLDFSVPEEQVISQIEKKSGTFSTEEKESWEKKGWLEFRLIDGKKMYFNRAASNLILIKKNYETHDQRLQEIAEEPEMVFRLKHTKEIIDSSDNSGNPVDPVNMKITYTITVYPDVVPDGKIIRCWLPWPKNNQIRQRDIKLLSTSSTQYKIAPDSAIHSTIYMEKKAKKGKPAIFEVSYTYQSSAQHFNHDSIKNLPYDKSSAFYRKYTACQPPQICFTPEIKKLADSITGSETQPAAIVKKIYMWFKENIIWTGALEYSTMPDIPEYVYKNHRGDCGMQTFMFISMLRYKGIPACWQSGWMVPPDAENLHDWSEVYYEGTGWVPVDISYDIQKSDNEALKLFYLSGIDSYRLIVNDGVSGTLYPHKKFLRSDPYDFQRGEVEWKGGNLYYDKWDYHMKIEYLK